MAPPNSKQALRILCFGDSLTEGYSSWGMVMTPYSTWLSSYLNAKLDSEYEIRVETDGRSGDCVVTGFQTRMNRHYPPQTTTTPYDWIIYLGGTNDLAYRRSPTEILTSTQEILSAPLSLGAKILILTVPEAQSKMIDRERNELNELIRGWGQETANENGKGKEGGKEDGIEDGKGEEGENVYVLDLWEKMKYHGISGENRKERWDDGLHFTPKGYEDIGELVGERLVEILRGGNLEEGRA